MRTLNGPGGDTMAPLGSSASDLMAAIGRLKDRFYDRNRGRVDYEAMRNSPDYRHYQELAAGLRRFDLASLTSSNEKLAFWINLYNAIVIHGIVEPGAAKSFVNSTEVLVLPEKNKVFLSQIFGWYEKDFGGKKGIRQFLLRYLDEDENRSFIEQEWREIKVEYLFYDWDLNH